MGIPAPFFEVRTTNRILRAFFLGEYPFFTREKIVEKRLFFFEICVRIVWRKS